MTAGEPVQGYRLHPVRLQFVYLKRLAFDANYLPKELPSGLFRLAESGQWRVNVSGNVHGNRATVVASVEASFEQGREVLGTERQQREVASESLGQYEDPYQLEVEVVAGFLFDPSEISEDEVDKWCKLGSFFVLAPYVRDVIARVTRESGFPEILLPLLEVPTFRAPATRNLQQQGAAPGPGRPPE